MYLSCATSSAENWVESSCSRWVSVPGKLNGFCWRVHCGDGWRGEGGVALGGSGGAGEDGVEDVVEEGLLLESGW